jgi:DNA replication protein DnaC
LRSIKAVFQKQNVIDRRCSKIASNERRAKLEPAQKVLPVACENNGHQWLKRDLIRTVKDLHLPGACPTCGFPPDQLGYVRNDVGISDVTFGRPQPCPTCYNQKQAEKRRSESQLEGWLAEANFKNYKVTDPNRAAFQAALKFARWPQGWLTLWGNYGCGKTHLLAAIANDCRANKVAVQYYTLPDWLDRLRKGYSSNRYSETLEYACQVKVLLLDEIDKVQWSDWVAEKVYQLADARYRHLEDQGTVLALNADPHRLLKNTEHAAINYLFSRMFDARSQVVHLAGPDVRPKLGQLHEGNIAE